MKLRELQMKNANVWNKRELDLNKLLEKQKLNARDWMQLSQLRLRGKETFSLLTPRQGP